MEAAYSVKGSWRKTEKRPTFLATLSGKHEYVVYVKDCECEVYFYNTNPKITTIKTCFL